MFKQSNVKASTRFSLWRKIRKLKSEHPDLEILEKNSSMCNRIKRPFWYAIIRYDDKIPLPTVLDKTFIKKTFYSEEDLYSFIEEQNIKNFWLNTWNYYFSGEHIWQLVFKRNL